MARYVAPTKLTTMTGVFLVVLLTGCTPGATSIELAEDAIRSNSIDVAQRLASYATKLDAPASLSPSQLAEVTENVAVDEAGLPVPVVSPGLQVGFASSSTSETLVVSALIRGHGQTHSGFGGSLHSLYACGDFVADFATRRVTVRDTECPSWLSGWIGSAEAVSLTDVAGDDLDDISW